MKQSKKIKFTEEEWAELNNTPSELNNTPSYEEWKKLFNDISKTTNKIMTPKEKAKELVDEFINLNQEHSCLSEDKHGMEYEYHIKCALKVVDEILKTFFLPIQDSAKNYWQEVKQEIQKL